MITIDENALRNETKDQSLIRSMFNFYSLTEIQLNPNYLRIKIYKNKENIFPMYLFRLFQPIYSKSV